MLTSNVLQDRTILYWDVIWNLFCSRISQVSTPSEFLL